MSNVVNNPNPKHVVSFILTPDLRDRLGRVAKAQGLSKSWLARSILAGWLDQHEAEIVRARAPNGAEASP
jgi:predicted transcriptional regulator